MRLSHDDNHHNYIQSLLLHTHKEKEENSWTGAGTTGVDPAFGERFSGF